MAGRPPGGLLEHDDVGRGTQEDAERAGDGDPFPDRTALHVETHGADAGDPKMAADRPRADTSGG